MGEQQLSHPEAIQSYERQKQLSHYLDSEEPAQLAMGLQLFLEQHAQLYSPTDSPTAPWRAFHTLADFLPGSLSPVCC